MPYDDLRDSINRINKDRVNTATFGHLAPMKNRTYKGVINVAVSAYDSCNPTILDIDILNLNDSPWLFDSVKELLWNLGDNVLKPSKVYSIKVTFRNYRWWTKINECSIT